MQTLLPSKFTGIIQLAPAEDNEILQLQDLVLEQFQTHQPIMKLHITLLHQSYPKKVGAGKERGDKLLKNMFIMLIIMVTMSMMMVSLLIMIYIMLIIKLLIMSI